MTDAPTTIQGGTMEMTSEFFRNLMTPDAWISNEHIDEILYWFHRRLDKYRDIFLQNVVILSDHFSQLMDGHYPNFAKAGVEKYVIEPNLVILVKGKKLTRWWSWKNCHALYVPINVNRSHWVCLVVDLVRCRMTVFDYDIVAFTDLKLGTYIHPFANLIPIILKATKDFDHLGVALTKKWTWTRPTNVCTKTKISGDCSIYMLKFMEYHMMGCSLLDDINDVLILYYRNIFAVELFEDTLEA